MRKLSIMRLNEVARPMSEKEMQLIIGGENNCNSSCSGGCTFSDGLPGTCGWTKDPDSSGGQRCTCTGAY